MMKIANYTIYEYDIRTGSFKLLSTISSKDSINNLLPWEDFKNKFLLIKQNNFENNDFHTIRIDNEGKVAEYRTIGPNNYDKDMLVDAIVGCRPSISICKEAFGQMHKKLLSSEEGEFWVTDIKDRLQKMSVIRLIEVYKKIKELT